MAHTLTLSLYILLAWASFSIWSSHTKRRRARARGCQAARRLPQWDPIFGLDVAIQMFRSYSQGNRSATFKKQHTRYGLTFQSIALGKTRIFTIDPVNLQSIFNLDFTSWGVEPLRLGPWGPLLGQGVMDTDGHVWRFSRDMLQPLFRKDQIADLTPFSGHVDRLLALIPRDGTTVDMQPLFARLILDFTMEFLFGESSATLTSTPDTDAIAFLENFHYAQANIGKRTQLPYLTMFTSDADFKTACKKVGEFVDRYTDKARERLRATPDEKGTRYILVDELLKQEISADIVRSQLLNVFLAAHDTTAVLMTNTMFNLARHPEVYQKLTKEVQRSPHVPASHSQLRQMSYLNHVITETSRLTPVVGQNARIAVQDTTIPQGGGESGMDPVYVSKGTSVQFNFFALHRRADVYGDDAEQFRPERWDTLHVGTWDFLPFSGGPRVCPANQMAFMQVCYTIARIAQAFGSIENRDPIFQFEEQYRITTDSKNGCKIAFAA